MPENDPRWRIRKDRADGRWYVYPPGFAARLRIKHAEHAAALADALAQVRVLEAAKRDPLTHHAVRVLRRAILTHQHLAGEVVLWPRETVNPHTEIARILEDVLAQVQAPLS